MREWLRGRAPAGTAAAAVASPRAPPALPTVLPTVLSIVLDRSVHRGALLHPAPRAAVVRGPRGGGVREAAVPAGAARQAPRSAAARPPCQLPRRLWCAACHPSCLSRPPAIPLRPTSGSCARCTPAPQAAAPAASRARRRRAQSCKPPSTLLRRRVAAAGGRGTAWRRRRRRRAARERQQGGTPCFLSLLRSSSERMQTCVDD